VAASATGTVARKRGASLQWTIDTTGSEPMPSIGDLVTSLRAAVT
jgi:hypothetical protein